MHGLHHYKRKKATDTHACQSRDAFTGAGANGHVRYFVTGNACLLEQVICVEVNLQKIF